MKAIVISIGGSVLFSEDIDISFFNQLIVLLKKSSKKNKIFIVVGGGKTARTYIKLGRELNFNEKTLDEIGIKITRINAEILARILKISNKDIPFTTKEAKDIDKPIVVMGGTTPGHSTDMVGAELAEKTHADKYIIATNVDGIYDKDPNKYSDAKKLIKVSIKKLIEKYGANWSSAGKNIVIDGPALEIIQRAKIPTFVVNGKKLDQLEKVITNQKFNGSTIKL